MGYPLRIFEPGLSLHIIRRGNNRCAIVGDDFDRCYWLRTLQHAAAACQVDVSYCTECISRSERRPPSGKRPIDPCARCRYGRTSYTTSER